MSAQHDEFMTFISVFSVCFYRYHMVENGPQEKNGSNGISAIKILVLYFSQIYGYLSLPITPRWENGEKSMLESVLSNFRGPTNVS